MLKKIHIISAFTLFVSGLTFNLSLFMFPQTARAEESKKQQSQTEDREGFPSRRVGGGTRGEGCSFDQGSLTALIPETSPAQTSQVTPTILFYVPKTPKPQTLEFVLNDQNDEPVYETTLTTTGNSGIISVKVPQGATQLKPDQEYHWYLSMVCNPDNRALDVVVEGLLQRVEINQTTINKLTNLSPLARVDFYEKAGLWYDALDNLLALKQENCHDQSLSAKWKTLLSSLGLDDLTSAQTCSFDKISSLGSKN